MRGLDDGHGVNLAASVERAFAPARQPGRIGAEVELIAVTDTDPPMPVDPAVLAGGFDDGFIRAARPSFEPGGQLELSPPPHRTVAELVSELQRLLMRSEAIAAARGVRLVSVGTNPYRARTRIWQGVDLRRTAYDGRHLDIGDPVRAYQSFATAAPRLPIPTAADPWYHLSTLFPPVRPRGGYLEVRYLDAQPLERIGEAVETVASLLCNRRVRRDALDLLLPRTGDLERAWSEAAAGFSPESADLLSIARTDRRRTPTRESAR